MNITYLIGNGFDVNIGLKSRYADFYETYVNIHPDDEADVIKRFKAGINDYIKKESHKDNLKAIDWRDLEVALGQFTDQMEEKEAEILYLDVNDRLKEYLIDEFRNFDAEAFSSNLFYSQLTNPVTRHFDRVIANEIKSFCSGSIGNDVYNIINFNYTRTIEKLSGFQGKLLPIGQSFTGRQAYLQAVCHIHQTLDDDEILVGVNDVTQIANEKFRENRLLSNMYIKPNTNRLLGSGVNMDCKSIIANTELFVIYGASVGITDQVWWRLVCERVINSNARLIYFVHKAQKRKHQNLYKDEMKREELSKLLENAGLDTKQVLDSIIEKCYVSFSDEMFKMPVTYNDRIKQMVTYKIGTSDVTMKVIDMGMKHIAVSVETTAEEAGVPSEKIWLKEFFPNYTFNSQQFLTQKIENIEVPFDFIPIHNGEKRKNIYFEISSFFGKPYNRLPQQHIKNDLKQKALSEVLRK